MQKIQNSAIVAGQFGIKKVATKEAEKVVVEKTIQTVVTDTIEIAALNLEKKTLNVLQELVGHETGEYYNVCDIKELSDGKLVSCSNHGEIIFWSLNPTLNIYEQFKYLKTYPNEYSSLLEDPQRNKLICASCFDSCGTCIIDLKTYEIITTFEEIAGNGGNEIYFVNDNIVIDNSAADEVGLFFIDMDKNEIVKHDEKFNDNNSSCFLKLENDNLLCSSVVERNNYNPYGNDDENIKDELIFNVGKLMKLD